MNVTGSERPLYRFLDFTFDPHRRLLRRGTEPLLLAPQALGVLAELLQRRGRPVARAELLSAVWPGVAVGDGSLTQAIWELRRALADGAPDETCVQTVRGVGYRFAAEVLVSASGACDEGAQRAPLVGRQAELLRLKAALGRAAENEGRTCVVSGPPGIGKTHLCRQLIAEARQSGFAVMQGDSLQCGDTPPFWPWLQMLGRHLEGAENEVRLACERLAPLASQLVPCLRSHELRVPRQQSPQEEHFYLLEDLARLFRNLTAGRRTVLVFEDVHWADAASLSFLGVLAQAIADRPALLLVTVRFGETKGQEVLTGLGNKHPNDHIELRGLEVSEVESILQLKGSGCAEFARQVCRLTGGNPLFTLELARLVGPNHQSFSDLLQLPELQVILERRLHGVSASALRLLQAAAVAGRELGLSQLAQLVDLGPELALECLDELTDGSLLSTPVQPTEPVVFAHPLMREAAYQSLPSRERAELHLKTAQRLEQLGSDASEARVSELAHHYYQASLFGHPRKAIHYARKAAEQASRQTAYADAVRHYRNVLSLLDSTDAEPGERLSVLLALAEACAAALHPEVEVKALFEQAAQGAIALSAPVALARAALGYAGQRSSQLMPTRVDGTFEVREIELLEQALSFRDALDAEQVAPLLASLAHVLAATSERARRDSLAREAVAIARTEGSPWLLARVLLSFVHTVTAPDQWSEQERAARELVLLSEQLPSRELRVEARIAHAMLALQVADLESARAHLAVAQRSADALGSKLAHARASVLPLLQALWSGDTTEAMRLNMKAWQACPDDLGQRLLFALRTGQILTATNGVTEITLEQVRGLSKEYAAVEGWRAPVAWAASTLGHHEEARREFDVLARDNFRALPEDHSWLATMQLLGETSFELADAARATLVYQRLSPYGNRLGLSGWSAAGGASVALSLGRLATVRRAFDEAFPWFERAHMMYSTKLESELGVLLTELSIAEAQLARARSRDQVWLAREHARVDHDAYQVIAKVAAFGLARRLGYVVQQVERVKRLYGDAPSLSRGRSAPEA